ncbi:hypothetical protein [Acidovorax sp. Leaf160]|uniref:hypothetical protein n=1 Tax=Acidovorax sp. Leaf160 TaxID=1736280 RepID=UPI000A6F36AF|nr:hypothetical protein [Acidovorax sp. Leaf160]
MTSPPLRRRPSLHRRWTAAASIVLGVGAGLVECLALLRSRRLAQRRAPLR